MRARRRTTATSRRKSGSARGSSRRSRLCSRTPTSRPSTRRRTSTTTSSSSRRSGGGGGGGAGVPDALRPGLQRRRLRLFEVRGRDVQGRRVRVRSLRASELRRRGAGARRDPLRQDWTPLRSGERGDAAAAASTPRRRRGVRAFRTARPSAPRYSVKKAGSRERRDHDAMVQGDNRRRISRETIFGAASGISPRRVARAQRRRRGSSAARRGTSTRSLRGA
mmetsp:Transcript_32317/g.97141  ORF Transcript_32317/g.97141 Transcript_32317/m.97141 type:complete len:222 (+) Transcript_32317:207-872(+)